jgi:hypothetical protein
MNNEYNGPVTFILNKSFSKKKRHWYSNATFGKVISLNLFAKK